MSVWRKVVPKAIAKVIDQYIPRANEASRGSPYMLMVSYGGVAYIHHTKPMFSWNEAWLRAVEVEEQLLKEWADPERKTVRPGQSPRVFVMMALDVMYMQRNEKGQVMCGHETLITADRWTEQRERLR